MHVVVLDLDLGNIQSLVAALDYLGAPHEVSADPRSIAEASHVILPGVGAFDPAVEKIDAGGFREPLLAFAVEQGRPLLGVCLGMQLLTRGSAEGHRRGLGLLPEQCVRLPAEPSTGHKVPHVGFAAVDGYQDRGLFRGLGPTAHFYFTHSYALPDASSADNTARCMHAIPFVAAFQVGNVSGVQFHPEKSQSTGLRILANFLEDVPAEPCAG